jgi:hypothetical protein
MELPNSLLTHLVKAGYLQDLNLTDLQQAAQGVARPILQFFMHVVQDVKTSEKIQGNLKLSGLSGKNHQVLSQKIRKELENAKKLENQASENLLKIQILKENLQRKKAADVILKIHQKKLEKISEKMKNFKTDLKDLKSEEKIMNSEISSRICENLVYLESQKGFELTESTVEAISSSSDIRAVEVFPLLTEKIESLKLELLEKIRNFSPEEEFSYLGVSLKKENGLFRVEEVDNNKLIDRLQIEVKTKRETIWQDFIKTETILEETEKFKSKLQNLLSKQKVLNPTFQKIQTISLNISGKKVQLESLKKSLKELEVQLEEKESQSRIHRKHSEKIADPDILTVLTEETLTKSSAIRKEILKKKLQIEEFLKKHFTSLKISISQKLNPLHRPFHRELKGFQEISENLLPFNVPNPRGKSFEESFQDLFKKPRLSKRIFQLFQVLNTEKFLLPEKTLDRVEDVVRKSQKFLFSEIPEEKIISQPKGKSLTKVLKDLKESTNISQEEIETLEESLQIWLHQPAQHLIPWRKDHKGLNITESLELWKSCVLGN